MVLKKQKLAAKFPSLELDHNFIQISCNSNRSYGYEFIVNVEYKSYIILYLF